LLKVIKSHATLACQKSAPHLSPIDLEPSNFAELLIELYTKYRGIIENILDKLQNSPEFYRLLSHDNNYDLLRSLLSLQEDEPLNFVGNIFIFGVNDSHISKKDKVLAEHYLKVMTPIFIEPTEKIKLNILYKKQHSFNLELETGQMLIIDPTTNCKATSSKNSGICLMVAGIYYGITSEVEEIFINSLH
jgi:hypothetical protein